jgi:hypothetical protein
MQLSPLPAMKAPMPFHYAKSLAMLAYRTKRHITTSVIEPESSPQ